MGQYLYFGSISSQDTMLFKLLKICTNVGRSKTFSWIFFFFFQAAGWSFQLANCSVLRNWLSMMSLISASTNSQPETLRWEVYFLMCWINKINQKPSSQCFLEYSCAPLFSCVSGKEEFMRRGMHTEFRFGSYGGATVLATIHQYCFGSTECNTRKEALLATDIPDWRSAADRIWGDG